ncbi:MAG: TAXI family TRAP transporter solute-binding subunit [Acetobacteraceae bacterium]
MTQVGSRVAGIGVLLRIFILAGIVAIVTVAAIKAKPPQHATIAVGPVGGSFYQNALKYQKLLAIRDITLELRPIANSLEILPKLTDPESGLDIGFEAQDVSPYQDGPLRTLGRIELQPLFIFASADLGRRSILTDLRGRKIVMPPVNSATADAAVRMFQLYDISPENSTFAFMPIAEAVTQLRAGQFDAGVFMLSPDNQLIRGMALDSGIRLMPVPEAKAVSDHLPFLRPVVIPRGIYDIADATPPVDTHLLAGRVNVVVRPNLHPYLIYSILEAMTEVHKGATYISDAGEYPTVVGSELIVHRLAAEFHRFGLPWLYQHLPPWPATFINDNLIVGLAVVVLVLAYGAIKYLFEVVAAVRTVLGIWILYTAERRMDRSGQLSRRHRALVRLAERALRRPSRELLIDDLLSRIREPKRRDAGADFRIRGGDVVATDR